MFFSQQSYEELLLKVKKKRYLVKKYGEDYEDNPLIKLMDSLPKRSDDQIKEDNGSNIMFEHKIHHSWTLHQYLKTEFFNNSYSPKEGSRNCYFLYGLYRANEVSVRIDKHFGVSLDELFYIGKTNNPILRYLEHWYQPHNFSLKKEMNILKQLSLLPEMVLWEACYCDETIKERENMWINLALKEGIGLCNIKRDFHLVNNKAP